LKEIINNIHWIFFDLDGTLIDSVDMMYNVYMEFLREFGKTGSEEEFSELNGPSLKEIISYLKGRYEIPKSLRELVERYENKINKKYEENFVIDKQTEIILQNLKKKGMKLAIVSSTSRKLIECVLRKKEWEKYFTMIVSGDEVKKSKPHPDIYTLCLRKTMANRNEILAVEDSKNGCASAEAAGINCIILDNENLHKLLSVLK